MYSNPERVSDYFFLAKTGAEGETEPLPVYELAGITSAKLGKIFRDRRIKYLKAHKKKEERLKPKDYQAIGEEVLIYVHRIAVKRQQKKSKTIPSAEWRLIGVDIIAREEGEPGFDEIPKVLATYEIGGPNA